jgi:inositol transport system permease protein
MIFMSLEDAGIPSAGSGYEFDALTASVIGGASFSGGTGTAIGTLFGALIICVLNNTMRLLAVNAYLQEVIKGSIIAIAVIVSIQAKIKQAPR